MITTASAPSPPGTWTTWHRINVAHFEHTQLAPSASIDRNTSLTCVVLVVVKPYYAAPLCASTRLTR